MRIVAFGDIHMEYGNIKKIPALAEADLVVITGDLTNFGGRADARQVLAAIRAINPNILALPGNLDQPEVGDLLIEEGISLHGQGRLLGNIGIFGVGGSNITPFKTPTEFSEAALTAILQDAHAQVKEAEHLILVAHPPPLNTRTDVIASGIHVGSPAVRTFIEAVQPALCLTGHIHEARGTDLLGATRIINPGMLKDGAWIEIVADVSGISAELAL
ncbi:MAG: hypothetical protein A2521_06905 [Deltaproteobacteria bacterium RIFOXYD12_FULL_57_12]|nr:MAG: hypothetical protein A2521_06905 [Deltaproteobacteria bacterium RIFOXYD12_FULL_57_12]